MLQGLNLGAINAETDRRGFIPVNERMQVLDKSGKPSTSVYCIGDANGDFPTSTNAHSWKMDTGLFPAPLCSGSTQETVHSQRRLLSSVLLWKMHACTSVEKALRKLNNQRHCLSSRLPASLRGVRIWLQASTCWPMLPAHRVSAQLRTCAPGRTCSTTTPSLPPASHTQRWGTSSSTPAAFLEAVMHF